MRDLGCSDFEGAWKLQDVEAPVSKLGPDWAGVGSQQDRDTHSAGVRFTAAPPRPRFVVAATARCPPSRSRRRHRRPSVRVHLPHHRRRRHPSSPHPYHHLHPHPNVLASPRRLVVASAPVSSPVSSPHRCPHLLAVAASSLPVQFGAVRCTPLFGAPRCTRVAIASSPRVVRSIVVASSSSSSSSRRRVLAGVVFTSSLPLAKTVVVVVSRFTAAPLPCASVTAVSARRRRRMKCSDACA